MKIAQPSQGFDYEAIYRAIDHEEDKSAEARGKLPPTITARTYTDAQILTMFREAFRWIIVGSEYSTTGGTASSNRRKRKATGVTDEAPNRSLSRVLNVIVSGRRAVAAAWVLMPELFDGGSLASIGLLPNVRTTRKTLCVHAKDFEDAFGIHCRAMRTEANRAQLSEAARARWEKRKAAARRARHAQAKAARPAINAGSPPDDPSRN